MSTDSNHNSEQPDAAEEIRLASFLRTIDDDSLAPDSAQLASLRQRTMDQFASESPTVLRPTKLWRGYQDQTTRAAAPMQGLRDMIVPSETGRLQASCNTDAEAPT